MYDAYYTQIQSLQIIIENNYRKRTNTHHRVGSALNHLRDVVFESATEADRDKMAALIPKLKIRTDAPYTIETEEALVVANQIASFLKPKKERPAQTEIIVTSQTSNVHRIIPESKKVFIVHGHDTANTLKLRQLLIERYGLAPVILSEQPSQGRSIIEKFEAIAGEAAFAFALLTPDDFITKRSGDYSQARPNVLFEIGWFYGRLGRDRVVLLLRVGTIVPSDLQGIVRVDFKETIDERVLEIENELHASGIISAPIG